ncbi:beta-lactamase-like protein [Xylogone sp. PMI_703]|nr:beta-lactamase-like protein [Xylogone sp. PMI_703]
MLNIPPSQNCVDVKIIDSTIHGAFPLALFAQPRISGRELIETAYCFYIEHPTLNKRVLFDLGMRKDYNNLPPKHAGMIQQTGWVLDVEKNVIEIIQEHGIKPDTIDSIIWSHAHADHTGDPSTFPTSTELVIGPGTTAKFMPGYPLDPDGEILESDYKDRPVREINFRAGDSGSHLEIGGFNAVDFFGDGSFYLLDTPGHEIGHMCGLARTTPNTFVLMGADGCHHPGVIRPNQNTPLPAEISPNPLDFAAKPCPCAMFLDIHPKKSKIDPYYSIALKPDGSGIMFKNVDEANTTIEKLKAFDADDNIFIVLSHDESLSEVIELIPKGANKWHEKRWKELSRWKFLADFEYS